MQNPFSELYERIASVETLLIRIDDRISLAPAFRPSDPDEVKPFNVEQAAAFLGISKQTCYQNIDQIPHRKRFGKLYFFQAELLQYVENGKGGAK